MSVTDLEDGDVYYAQLRGFLTDEYAEKVNNKSASPDIALQSNYVLQKYCH